MNANMPKVAACFEAAGFADVRTVLSSGNVVFSARRGSAAELAAAIEKALSKGLGRTFLTIVRSIADLQALLDKDPFAGFAVPEGSKRVVTFLRAGAKLSPTLPPERDGARIWAVDGGEAFTSYLRSAEGPIFMEMIKKTFGDAQTTRTWDTIGKVVRAAATSTPAQAPTARKPQRARPKARTSAG